MAASINTEPDRHIPVLLEEILRALKPVAGEVYVDGTFGAGGYTRAILEAAPCSVIAIDQDPGAIADGSALADEYGTRLMLNEGRFSDMAAITTSSGHKLVDGIVLDVGVSSMQLDTAGRGFSFQNDGPLDMRMGSSGPTAADVINNADEAEIADILYHLGDERRSRALAKAILKQRTDEPFTSTAQLSNIVIGVLGHKKTRPGKPKQKHPATRTFQALRIYVNDELFELGRALLEAESLLKPGGRLVVVTFHSLEDRIVKRFFASRTGNTSRGSRHLPQTNTSQKPPSFQFVNRRSVSPNKMETDRNARARSARLRAVIRTDAPAWSDDDTAAFMPDVPRLG